jgi:Ca2+-binding EF-hand superfamily protein
MNMPTVTIDTDTLMSLIKKTVREAIREEKILQQLEMIPKVSNEEMNDIIKTYGDKPNDEEFVDMTSWIDDEN